MSSSNTETSALPPAPRKVSVLKLAKTVAWSFFGIRKMSAHQEAAAQITFPQAIVAGIVGAAIVVGCFATIAVLATS